MSDQPPPTDPPSPSEPPSEPPPPSGPSPSGPPPSDPSAPEPSPSGPSQGGELFYGDVAPHRGGLILILGIGSIVTGVVGLACCGLIALAGVAAGIFAWILGRADGAKIAEGSMDPLGKGLTDAGKICGIIGVCISGLGFVFQIIFVIVYVILGAKGGQF